MKQYTSKDQTAKLIELGFSRPKPSFYQNGATWIQCDGDYSIGELIGFLPKRIGDAQIDFFAGVGKWFVRYEDRHEVPPITVKRWHSRELIDSLFDACVTIKEEGVI